MIATNEEQRIVNCLQSVAPYIDYAVIVDSGNTDNTGSIARDYLLSQDIDPSFFYHKFTSGGDQRSYALEMARILRRAESNDFDYLIMLDADNILQVEEGADPFANLTADCYSIRKVCGHAHYGYACIFRADQQWAYEGIIHEYPTRHGTAAPFTMLELAGCHVIEPVKTWENRNLYQHYYDHALLLERELFDNKDLPDHLVARYWFYLAQSYKDAGNTDRAVECYRRRIELGGWAEEVYISMLYVARLTADQHALVQAWNYRPQRLEAAYDLMQQLSDGGLYNLAAVIGAATLSVQPSNDILFLETNLYNGEFMRLQEELLKKVKYK